jgi:protein SCO1/2
MERPLDIGKTVGAALGVAALGAGLLWHLTAGLTLFTSESWRRDAIEKNPIALPDVSLQDERGQFFKLRSLCGQVMVLDFIYTRCPTVCKTLGASSSQLAQRWTQDGHPVTVLSISFDPANDEPAQLADFKKRMESQASPWRLARPTHMHERDQLLAAANVVVIPDGMQGYDHNAALHIVNKDCRISQILDLEDIENANRKIQSLL